MTDKENVALAAINAKIDALEQEVGNLHDALSKKGVNSRGTTDIFGRIFTMPVRRGRRPERAPDVPSGARARPLPAMPPPRGAPAAASATLWAAQLPLRKPAGLLCESDRSPRLRARRSTRSTRRRGST